MGCMHTCIIGCTRNAFILTVTYTQLTIPVNQRSWSNIGLMLHHCLRRWHDTNPALDQCLISCLFRCRCKVGLISQTMKQHWVNVLCALWRFFWCRSLTHSSHWNSIGPTYCEGYIGAGSSCLSAGWHPDEIACCTSATLGQPSTST